MNYYSLATQKNNAAEFKIEKYSLSLRIDRQLYCEATLDLNRDNLSIYSFTLYHGFKVKSICSSSGKALRFNQDGDYISVYREEEPLNRITIKCSGCAPRFFSNSQGTSLPGWFPYYPHAGEKELYDCSMYGFNRIFCSKGTEFEISILDKNKVFCSLDKKDEKYVGKSNGVTIVSGFYDSLVCENIQVVYPYLDTTEFLPESIKKQISEYVKNGIIKKTSKKVMVIANLNMASIYERYCSFSDHTTVSQLLGLSTVYEGQMFPSYKLALRNAFDYYESDKANWNSLINLLNEAYAGDKELLENDARTILQKVIGEMGSAYVESKVKEYLYDDNDTRHWKSFIEELRGENND